jgi:hypothetical protein
MQENICQASIVHNCILYKRAVFASCVLYTYVSIRTFARRTLALTLINMHYLTIIVPTYGMPQRAL